MSWINKVPAPPPEHKCAKPVPRIDEAWIGSTWKCDECSAIWRICDWVISLPEWCLGYEYDTVMKKKRHGN